MIHASIWQPSGGILLEPNAEKAVKEVNKSLALTAGPGAGKTEMLAQKADFLLTTGYCPYPKRILAIAFKVDAAKNLKDRVQKRSGYEFASRFDSFTFHGFAKRIIDKFRPVLIGNHALSPNYTIGGNRICGTQITFNDMIPLALEIIEKSPIAKNSIQKTYSDVFLDEFQDCTGSQYELLKAIFVGSSIRLTAVGDTKQKIMGWAGALEGIYKTFADDFAALGLNMYQNFRAAPVLRRMQNEMVKVMDQSAALSDEEITGEGGAIKICPFSSDDDEATNLANQIETWIGQGLPPSEIAVLVKIQPHVYAKKLINLLHQKGIPVRNDNELQDLMSEPLSVLIFSYLQVIYGKREPKAWRSLMGLLVPYAEDSEELGKGFDWQVFLGNQRKLTKKDESCEQVWDRIKVFLRKVELLGISSLSPDYESKSRLKELLDKIKAQLSNSLNSQPDIRLIFDQLSQDETVRILTIHKCKGLEFERVIVLGVENEFYFDKKVEDRRSAFFVAISRAKQTLLLTNCQARDGNRRSPYGEFLSYAEIHTKR